MKLIVQTWFSDTPPHDSVVMDEDSGTTFATFDNPIEAELYLAARRSELESVG
ncbi:MAG TPA: hypothetical protein VM140_06345 [Burkholderiales bacterium]|nr:hypothetical protein [Burkholderiales bacterium]